MMKFFIAVMIFTFAVSANAGVIGGSGGGDSGDDSLKSIKTTILTKDGIIGELLGGRLGRTQRRGRLLNQLGGGDGGEGGGNLGGVVRAVTISKMLAYYWTLKLDIQVQLLKKMPQVISIY